MLSRTRKAIFYLSVTCAGWGILELNQDLNRIKPCESEILQNNIKTLQEGLEQITLTSGKEIINPRSEIRVRYDSIDKALQWSEQAYQKSLVIPGMKERISENHHYRKQVIYDTAIAILSAFTAFGLKIYSLKSRWYGKIGLPKHLPHNNGSITSRPQLKFQNSLNLIFMPLILLVFHT